jgi:hypothetical protein
LSYWSSGLFSKLSLRKSRNSFEEFTESGLGFDIVEGGKKGVPSHSVSSPYIITTDSYFT